MEQCIYVKYFKLSLDTWWVENINMEDSRSQ